MFTILFNYNSNLYFNKYSITYPERSVAKFATLATLLMIVVLEVRAIQALIILRLMQNSKQVGKIFEWIDWHLTWYAIVVGVTKMVERLFS